MVKEYDFTQVDALKKKLDALRPLNAELYRKLKHKFNIDWTYNSNAIEGNTLTFSETRFFLEEGLTSKGKPLSEYLEMKNHQFALDYIEQVIQKKEPLSERLIKELHAMLFERNEIYEIENEQGRKVKISVLPGKYKQQNNYVLLPDGSRKYYLDPLKVVDAMQDIVKFYKKEKNNLHPIVLASELHARFVNIHPFVDGNGHVARLIMNIVLMQFGYEPTIIRNEFKQDYYSALREYDEVGNLGNFISIVEQEAIRTLQITLNAVSGEAVFDKTDIGKRLDHFVRSMQSLEKDVGKYAKKVSKEDKINSIHQIRDYLYTLTQEKIGGFQDDIFEFSLDYPHRLENLEISADHIMDYLRNKNIIPEEQGYKYNYVDFISDQNDGSGFLINLKASRAFIPTAKCAFVVIPTKYALCVCYGILVSSFDQKDNENFDKNDITIGFIENGVLWEDWHKSDLDNLFTEVFDQFLSMVQAEAEQRRIKMENKNDLTKK